LAKCARIDECKSWADRAAALASYAKQADDEQLLNNAKRIKARAIDRMGELGEEIPEQPGKRTDLQPSGSAPTRSLAEGADLADTVETWRGGKLSMSGKVGELAKWQVVFASTGPRLVRHKGCILGRLAAETDVPATHVAERV
jgi:hypothetical protein